jgi:lipoprotein signal peptidase
VHYVSNCKFLFSNFLDYKQFDLVSLIVLIIFTAFLVASVVKTKRGIVAVCFVAVGAFMNIVERHFMGNGCVRDYIDFFGLFVFNVYDLILTVGIIALLFESFVAPKIGKNGKS